jgi:phage/plasmid-associated DNA primase
MLRSRTVADIHRLFDGMIATGHSNDLNGSPARPADYSDEALASRFTARHRDDLRFVNTWGRWLVWDGKRWQPDETLIVTDHARGLVREASSEILSLQKLATVVASAKTVSAIERLARADHQQASQTGDWDRDPWLLNTPTGTIDLKTGQVRPHDRRDLITKMTAVGPAGDCPMWLSFLNRIFNRDQNLIGYIQGLAEKLKEEWPGILAWAIEGCLGWQRIGLVPPSAVTKATEDYLTEEDAVGRFISECCERHPQAQAELKDLYAAYKRFCETTGETVMSQKSFSQKLEGQNLVKGNDSRSRRVRFQGIRLRPKDDDPEAWVSSPDADALRGSSHA